MSADSIEKSDEIWTKDKLNRKSYADFLYQIIKSAHINNTEDNALIFSIDGDWGTGKSFFIDLWMEQLKKDSHLVSRFDAWKNDIIDDPLIGFVSHVYAEISNWQNQLKIDKYLAKESNRNLADLARNAKERILPICTEVVKGLAKKGASYIVTEEVVDYLLTANKDAEIASEQDDRVVANNLIENKIIAHNKNLELIEEFKEQLAQVAESLTKLLDKNLPVIIFIDELDRCRPDYAVKLLEVLKHVFNSENICFIASVNITQLEHSIKTIYGNEFNSELYLDRFFNYRLNLPKPSVEDYVRSMNYFDRIDYELKFDDFKKNNKNQYNYLLSEEGVILQNCIKNKHYFIFKVCESYSFNFREINNIFGKMELISQLLRAQWSEMSVIDDLVFLILAFVFKNKKVKREYFDMVGRNWSGENSKVLGSLKDDKLIIHGYTKNGIDLKFIKLNDLMIFFEYVNSRVGNSITSDGAKNIFYKYRGIIFSAMKINASDGEACVIVRKILDSYIDACFMAATIDPRKDVVLN